MIYKAVCTFRVFSNSISLTELEEALHLKSTGGYNMGDRISKNNPDSKLRIDSLWTLDVEKVNEEWQDASELFDKTLCELLEKIEELRQLVDEYSCDVQAAMFSNNDQINFYLSNATIKRLSSAGIDIMFSGYAGTVED